MLRVFFTFLFACIFMLTAKSQRISRDQETMTQILELLTLKLHHESFPWRNAGPPNQRDTSGSEQRRRAYYEAVAAIRAGGKSNRYHLYINKTLKKNSEHINIKTNLYSPINPISSYLDPNNFITDRVYLKAVRHSLSVLNRDTLVDLKTLRVAGVIP